MMDISKASPASKFPVDDSKPLRPTKAFYFQEGSEFSRHIIITDVTDDLPDLDNIINSVPAADAVKTAKSAVIFGKKAAFLEISREGSFTTAWTAKSTSSDTPVAELSSPLLTLGRWTIMFAPGSPHSHHDILLRPAGFMARADEFVKDSIPYFWDIADGRKLCVCHVANDGKRVEVARFLGHSSRGHDGLLVVDGEALDEVVAALTCVAVLNRNDSFRA
jgi:hypothetical protein